MSVFTDAEIEFLRSQRLARIATASATGLPDVSPVTFGLDDDCLVSGGFDITKTVRYKHLLANPRATMVIDELVTVDPWAPRGLKVRGPATLEDDGSGKLSVRIRPAVIWSWGINAALVANPGAIEKRVVEDA